MRNVKNILGYKIALVTLVLLQGRVFAQDLEILFASYGNHSKTDASERKSVTDTVRSNIQNNQITIPASGYNNLFGDPKPGLKKSFIIVYKLGNYIYANLADEYSSITIPSSSNAICTLGETASFKILKAWYGDPRGKFNDVTSYAWPIQNNQIQITPNNTIFGPDPAPYIKKGLIVIIKIGQYFYFQVLEEGQPGTIVAGNALRFYTLPTQTVGITTTISPLISPTTSPTMPRSGSESGDHLAR